MKQNPYFLDISPSDIVLFDDVPRKTSVCYVTFKNVTSRRVAFKIRTTSPKSYNVKPNNGVIMPNEEKKIEFFMQPVEEVPSSKKQQDKFMIMAIDINQDFDVSRLAEVWKDLPENQVQQVKLVAGFKGSQYSQSFAGGERKMGNSVTLQRDSYGGDLRNSTGGTEKVRMSMPVSIAGRPTNYQDYPVNQQEMAPSREDRNGPSQHFQETKIKELEVQILRLTDERNQFFNELTTLKESLEKGKGSNKGNYSSYQLWHVLLVAIISLIIGAFLSADPRHFE